MNDNLLKNNGGGVYFKEYNKSLVRVSELATGKSEEQLRNEFNQGISTHPDHIR